MENSALIIVDMQNDFITGALGSREAQKIVPNVQQVINDFNGRNIYITIDSHTQTNYSETVEGQLIPEHCIYGTKGILIESSIEEALNNKDYQELKYFHKNAFGSLTLADTLYEDGLDYNFDTIYIVGLCTDICVISNALIARSVCPKAKIVVFENCCVGSTPKKHIEALHVMESNCIEVKRWVK